MNNVCLKQVQLFTCLKEGFFFFFFLLFKNYDAMAKDNRGRS